MQAGKNSKRPPGNGTSAKSKASNRDQKVTR